MSGSKMSKTMALTLAFLFLMSYPTKISAGLLAFGTCVVQLAGPVCASTAAAATASCAATAWAPPLFCACVSTFMVASCGFSCAACIGALITPTP